MRYSSRERVNIRDCERFQRRLLRQRSCYLASLGSLIEQMYSSSRLFKTQATRTITTPAHYDQDVETYRNITREMAQNLLNESWQQHRSAADILHAWRSAHLEDMSVLRLLRSTSDQYIRELAVVRCIAIELQEIADDDVIHNIVSTPSSRHDSWNDEDALYGYAEDVENLLWGLSDHLDSLLLAYYPFRMPTSR